ncbi:MAG: hypothetical protein DKINENOH_00797 [bacterium]|nr:hypothetical protein [bacterium]
MTGGGQRILVNSGYCCSAYFDSGYRDNTILRVWRNVAPLLLAAVNS